ncbi:hypothetical protein [Actinomadura sp. 6N118]|uniref:hypothetical protein n=1 Tax=Actinomadura sp. 6N118 TaxID=3375151 RepID=UPI0037AFEAA7
MDEAVALMLTRYPTGSRTSDHPFTLQIWRLVAQTPERLLMPVLAALCDVFECPRPS